MGIGGSEIQCSSTMNPLTKKETTGAEAVPDLAIQSMGGARRMIQVLLLRGFSSAMTNKGSYVCSDPLRRHHRRPGRWVSAGRTTTPPAMVLMMTNSMTKTESMEIEVEPNLSPLWGARQQSRSCCLGSCSSSANASSRGPTANDDTRGS